MSNYPAGCNERPTLEEYFSEYQKEIDTLSKRLAEVTAERDALKARMAEPEAEPAALSAESHTQQLVSPRQPVQLSDDEILNMAKGNNHPGSCQQLIKFARAVIAAYEEKQNGR